jgi:hypothetical protein
MSDNQPTPGLRQCRSLTVRGVQCRSTAVRGHGLCHTHLHYRHPELPQGPKIAIPLYEDHSALQLATTQIAHGLLTGQLDPARARALSYNCQVAAMTLPRPHQPRYKALDAKPTPDETVADITTAPDGSPLGPDLPWLGPGGKFEPSWSISKYFYENECKRLQQKIPASAAEYPEEGWLTEAEQKEPAEDWRDRTTAHLRRLRIVAGEGTRRDLEAELADLQQKLAALREKERAQEARWWLRPAPAHSSFAPERSPAVESPSLPSAAPEPAPEPAPQSESAPEFTDGATLDLEAAAAPGELPAPAPGALPRVLSSRTGAPRPVIELDNSARSLKRSTPPPPPTPRGGRPDEKHGATSSHASFTGRYAKAISSEAGRRTAVTPFPSH